MSSQMIALDAHVIGERETGNETYTVNLARALLAADPQRTFALLTPHPENLPPDIARAANARVVTVRPANHLLRVPLALPLALRSLGAGLVHVNYVTPPLCPCPAVTTVHDLSYEIFPHDSPPRDRLVLGMLLPTSARGAAAVIAVSENTRKDISRYLGVPDERIEVIYEAAPWHIRRISDESEFKHVQRAYGVADRYVLAVGNVQPRKNLLRLIQAYEALHNEGVAGQLVLVGKGRFRTPAVTRLVRERGLDSVVMTGYVPDDDLAVLYSRAAVFAYPSLYEGFGLPVLEAMTCGTPVVTSNVSSLPEVAGDAGLLVDPTDVAAIAAALRAVLTRPELADDLRERGLKRAALFSWQKAARQTLAVYDRVLGKRAG